MNDNSVRVVTDHRMPVDTAVLMAADVEHSFSFDRSFVIDGCPCDYCRWEPSTEDTP